MDIVFKFLGLMDLIFGIAILILNLFPFQIKIRITVLALLYFIIKFALFLGDIATLFDFLIGIYFLIILFVNVKIITIISALYLLQKAILTLVS